MFYQESYIEQIGQIGGFKHGQISQQEFEAAMACFSSRLYTTFEESRGHIT